jgi:hypothetical protein
MIMAKEKNGSSGLAYLLVIIIGIITFAYITVCNLLNFDVIFKFGPVQYGYNLVHLHKDYSCTAEREIKVYQGMIPIDEMGRTGAYILKPGDRFALKGYRTAGYVTWLAVEFFIKDAQVNAYAYIPDDIPIPTFSSAMPFSDEKIKNPYFRELSAAELASIKDSYRSRFIESVSSRFQLQVAHGPEEMQRIKESKTHKLIPPDYMNTDKSTAYYCTKDQFSTVDKLYGMYLGDNFNANLYQNSAYNPEVDGAFRESIFYRVIDSLFFKIVVLVAFILYMFATHGSAPRESEA